MELGGYSWERAGRIWYEAATSEVGVRCSFSHFAKRTVELASRLPRDVSAAVHAWRSVGLSVS